MAGKRGNRSRQGSGGGIWLLLVVGLLLVALGYLAWRAYQKQRQESWVTAESPELISEDRLIYGGMPRSRPGAGPEAEFHTLKRHAYIAGYSESRKDPLWVAYRVFRKSDPFHLQRPSGFHTDPETQARVKDSDYTRSGFDRGHMAPNAAIAECYGEQAQLETFLLSNICPQSKTLNEDVWKRLETMEHQFAAQFEEIWVIDGPVFADINQGTTSRLPSGIAIPSAFFKILIDEDAGKLRVFCVIMPQTVKDTQLPQEFLTSVREIENQTHLDFFWKLDAATQERLETATWPIWKLN